MQAPFWTEEEASAIKSEIGFSDILPGRACDDCTLCCKLMPVKALQKPANERCPHMRFRTGCAIFERRPRECRLWCCRWLVDPLTKSLKRPDKAHYLIDIIPDIIESHVPGKPTRRIGTLQIWVDPLYPKAYLDPDLKNYIKEYAKQNVIALIRMSSGDGFLFLAPRFTKEKGWREVQGVCLDKEYSAAEVSEVFHGG